MDNQTKGAYAEERALHYLQGKGYTLLQRNYRAGHKEIDIIMKDGACIVFVEVKARYGDAFGAGREAVGLRKQQHIAAAAARYLQTHRLMDVSARFDVVEVDTKAGRLTHITDAFRVNS